jgi:arylsulfatase A-like enzyme
VGDTEDNRPLAVAFDVLWLDADFENDDAPQEQRLGSQEAKRADGGLLQPIGSELLYRIHLPQEPVLSFRAHRPSLSASSDPIRVQVHIRGHGTRKRALFSAALTSGSEEGIVELSGYEGQDVELGLFIGEPDGSVPPEYVLWERLHILGNSGLANLGTNVVFIVIDTLRADHLSSYGGTTETPHIDSLAREGVLFGNAYAHIPITGPSHASMFTSLLPMEHNVRNNAQIFPEQFETLPELLQSNYRRTAAFVSLGVLSKRFGFRQGFDEYDDEFQGHWWRSAGEMNQRILPWLRRNHKDRFFLWAHYSDPHEPYTPPDEEYFLFDVRSERGGQLATVRADGHPVRISLRLQPGVNRIRLRPVAENEGTAIRFSDWSFPTDDVEMTFPDDWDLRTKRVGVTVVDAKVPGDWIVLHNGAGVRTVEWQFTCQERLPWEEHRARYSGEVVYVDREVGRLLDTLEELGIREKTLVILTSDHGELLGEHGMGGHIEPLYEPLLRVPLIMSYPGVLPAERVVSTPVRHIDILPTLLDLLGIPSSGDMRGRTLLPLVEGHSGAEPSILIAETYRPQASQDRKAIIADGYKYIRTESGGEELYFLRQDSAELDNLREEELAILAKMRALLEEEEARAAQAAVNPPTFQRMSEQDKQRLRTLGYVQ